MLSRTNMKIILILVFIPTSIIEGVRYPTSTMTHAMSCEEFERSARFNPYSVIGDVWMTFFYWADHKPSLHHTFYYPKPKERAFLKHLLHDDNVTVPVNWTARFVMMQEQRSGHSGLLVEKGDRGQFWYYHFGVEEGKKFTPTEVRLKQTSDNKYFGFMDCETEMVFLMARIPDVPPRTMIPDAVARIGYRGRGGRSYLYQGHHWMPIGEMEDHEYWNQEQLLKQEEEQLKRADEMIRKQMSKKKQLAQKWKEDNDRVVDKKIVNDF